MASAAHDDMKMCVMSVTNDVKGEGELEYIERLFAQATEDAESVCETLWLAADETQRVFFVRANPLRGAGTNDVYYLTLGWPNIWQWFQLREVSLYSISRSGTCRELPINELHRFCYALPAVERDDAWFAVRLVKEKDVVCVPKVVFKTTPQIFRDQQLRILERGTFYGIFIGLILVAAYGLYSLRDRTFLWYIIQLIASIMLMTVESPLVCFPRLSAEHHAQLYQITLVLFYACSMVFCRYYLDTAVHFPRIDKYLRTTTVLCLVYVASYVVLPPWLRSELVYLFDVLAISALLVSYYIWWKGYAAGKYYAIATIAFIPIYAHYVLVELFQLSPIIPLNDMIAFGNLFEGLVFPIALVARVRLVVAEKRRVDEENARLQTEQMRAEMLAREAELRMLRFQMNPHFLFNALSSLIVEISDDPKSALRIAEKLSAYLRYTLTRRELVSLSEEIQAVRQYLELEEIRFEEQLRVQLSLPNTLPNVEVPMFCIQPLVENAIKYGMQTSPAPLQVRIGVERLADGISIEVANTGEWCEKTAKTTGVGLTNVQERLRIYYPDAHEFARFTEDGWVRVRLVIR